MNMCHAVYFNIRGYQALPDSIHQYTIDIPTFQAGKNHVLRNICICAMCNGYPDTISHFDRHIKPRGYTIEYMQDYERITSRMPTTGSPLRSLMLPNQETE